MTQTSLAYANQAYRGAAVVAPPLKSVIMLLNGAISFLQKSLRSQQEKRLEEGFEHLTRATAILRGLSYHLDSTRGGEMTQRLYETYNSLILACLNSYGRPKAAENFQRIIGALTQLREAWEFVETAKKATAAVRESGVG
jgi:flagellar secretion chaperone FliS